MTTRLNPYLHLLDNAREALEFYHAALGGTLVMSTFGEAGISDDPTFADRIMHGELSTESGLTLMASDTPPEMPEPTQGTTISVCLNTDDPATDLSGIFATLATGGSIKVPFGVAPWGDLFGIIDDKFGITWLFNGASA